MKVEILARKQEGDYVFVQVKYLEDVSDKKTGENLGDIRLPGDPYGNPITYSHEGKQYIAVALGGGGFMGGPGKFPAEIVALALPR